MKPGQASQTAVMVCTGRAVADRARFASFADPTAMPLLPEEARARVEQFFSGTKPQNLSEGMARGYLDRLSRMMVPRTVAIDAAIREADAPQVVILGAGLDGRAWRMKELSKAIVFEVDHPDTQADKRTRAAALVPLTREVRFVPVDFSRDSLDAALTAADHDPTQPTTWVWEGVVMYLDLPAIEAALLVVQRRSAPGSRLIVAYHRKALMLHLVGMVTRRFGEPLKSAFTVDQMQALLARYGFAVVRDEDVATIATRISPEIARATRPVRHLRIAVADRTYGSA